MIFCIAYQCFWVQSYLRFLVQTKRRDMFPRKTTLKFLKFPPIDTILYSFLSRFWHLFTELTGHVAIALVSFLRWLIQFLYELSTKFTENQFNVNSTNTQYFLHFVFVLKVHTSFRLFPTAAIKFDIDFSDLKFWFDMKRVLRR